MPRKRLSMHPICRMVMSVAVTGMSFAGHDPLRLGIVCAVAALLLFVDYDRRVWRNLFVSLLICGAVSAITFGFARDTAAALTAGLHLEVLLLGSYFLLQTSAAERLHGLQSCHIPDQLLLGFLVMYRFVDVLRRELHTIYQASTLVPRHRIGPFRKLYRCLIIPFSYRMLTLSDQLSLSVRSRDFGAGERTQYTENPIRIWDITSAILISTLTGVILWMPFK